MDDEAVVTLVLGGARSGKSAVAERLAARHTAGPEPVTYVATATPPGDGPEGDEAWAARIAAHRARRPAEWDTAEVAAGGSLGDALSAIAGPALVDSLGTYVAGLERFGATDDGRRAIEGLVAVLRSRRTSGQPTVVVSEEVGLGVVPSTAVGNAFRDALGALNQRVADECDQVLLVVAGRVLSLEGGAG